MKLVLILLGGIVAWAAQASPPVYVIPAPAAEQLARLQERPQRQGPRRIGQGVPMALDSRVDGAWQSDGQRRIWTAELHAAGAEAISLRFVRAELPPGARLSLLDGQGQPSGPDYTPDDVRDGGLWTGLVLGDSVRLRLDVPAHAEAHLVLERAHYASLPDQGLIAKAGSCHIDAVCEDDARYRGPARATVLVQYVSGDFLYSCSGFLINNSRRDLTPYLLTANHCGIHPGNQDSVQVYWKFQSSSCDGSASLTTRFRIGGTQVLAAGQRADFTLMVLGTADNPLVPPADYEPFWVGWDLDNTPPSEGAGFHHPAGDQKAISLFNTPLQQTPVDVDGRMVESWRVVWSRGVTEPGSSGSALFDESGRAIGLLSGGLSSCDTPFEPDFYARLNVAWTEGLTCDGQLAYWLNPALLRSQRLDGADLATAQAAPRVRSCLLGTLVSDLVGVIAPTPRPAPPGGSPSDPNDPTDGGGGGGGGATGIALMLFLSLAWHRRRRLAR